MCFFWFCFRLLLRILQQQQASFVLRHSENTLKSTDEVLQCLNPQDSTLQALTQVRTTLLSLRSGMSTSSISFSSLPPKGNVRRPEPREDEGRQPGWGESEQYMCAELQGPLVEQDLIDRGPGDWWTIGWTLILLWCRLKGTCGWQMTRKHDNAPGPTPV